LTPKGTEWLAGSPAAEKFRLYVPDPRPGSRWAPPAETVAEVALATIVLLCSSLNVTTPSFTEAVDGSTACTVAETGRVDCPRVMVAAGFKVMVVEAGVIVKLEPIKLSM